MVRSGGVWCGEVWCGWVKWFPLTRNSGSQLSKGLFARQGCGEVRLGWVRYGMVRFGGVGFGVVRLGQVRSTTEWLFSGSIPGRWLCP